MFIVDGTLSEEDATAVANTVQSFISSKGTILKADAWGRRRMAYPINKKSDGYYWVISYASEPGDVDALKYNLRVNENIIRWLITRPEHKKAAAVQPEAVVAKETPVSQPAVPVQAPVAETVAPAAPVAPATPAPAATPEVTSTPEA